MSSGSEFDEFYAAYPRKRAPVDARKAWEQTAKDRPPLKELLESLEFVCRSDYNHRALSKVPYPATWLRGHQWEDAREFAAVTTVPSGSQFTPLERVQFMARAAYEEASMTMPKELEKALSVNHFHGVFRKLTGTTYWDAFYHEKGLAGFLAEKK